MAMEVLIFNAYWSSLEYYNNGKTMTVVDGVQGANGVNVSPDNKQVLNVSRT